MPYKQNNPLLRKKSPLNNTVTRGMLKPSNILTGLASKISSNFAKMDIEDFIVPQGVQNLIPMNLRGLGQDLIGRNITGYHGNITERHMSNKEREALTRARIYAESQGRNYIEYDDYHTEYDNMGNKVTGNMGDVGGKSGSGFEPITKLFNPDYAVKSTFGQLSFRKNPDGTYTYTDQYNFNDAGTREALDETFLEGVKKKGLSLYGQVRNIGRHFGSPEGEGAIVNITF